MRRVVYSLLLFGVCFFSALFSHNITSIPNYSTFSLEDHPKIVISEELHALLTQTRNDFLLPGQCIDEAHERDFCKQVEECALQMMINSAPEGVPAGTLIKIPDGYIPVEQLEKDMIITSFDEEADELAEPRVVDVRKTMIQELIVATLTDGRTVEIAPNSSFYHHKTSSWVLSDNLDAIKEELAAYYELDVVTVEKVTIEEPQTIYLLTLEPHHNFFITTDDILVHNHDIRVKIIEYSNGELKVFGMVIHCPQDLLKAAAVGAAIVAALYVIVTVWEKWYGPIPPEAMQLINILLDPSKIVDYFTCQGGNYYPPGLLTEEQLRQGRMMEIPHYDLPRLKSQKQADSSTEQYKSKDENLQEFIEYTSREIEIIGEQDKITGAELFQVILAEDPLVGRLFSSPTTGPSIRRALTCIPLIGRLFHSDKDFIINETVTTEMRPKRSGQSDDYEIGGYGSSKGSLPSRVWARACGMGRRALSYIPIIGSRFKPKDVGCAHHHSQHSMPVCGDLRLDVPFSTLIAAETSAHQQHSSYANDESIKLVTNTQKTTHIVAEPTLQHGHGNGCNSSLRNTPATLVFNDSLGGTDVEYREHKSPIEYDTIIDEAGRCVERATQVTKLIPQQPVRSFTPQNPDMISFVDDVAAHNAAPTMTIKETVLTEKHVEFPTPRTPELNIDRTLPIAPFTQPTLNLESTLENAHNRPRPIIYEMNGITNDPCKKSSSNQNDHTCPLPDNAVRLKALQQQNLDNLNNQQHSNVSADISQKDEIGESDEDYLDDVLAETDSDLQALEEATQLSYKALHEKYNELLAEEYPDGIEAGSDAEHKRLVLRHKALQETMMSGGKKVTRCYALSEIVLQKGDVEYIAYSQELHGTAYQHVLQAECNELYEKACEWRAESNGNPTAELLTQCVEAGIGLNQHQRVEKSTMIVDCCWGIFLGALEGVFSSVYQKTPLAHFHNRVNSAIMIGGLIGSTLYYTGDLCYAHITGDIKHRDELLKQPGEMLEAGKLMLTTMPPDQVARHTTAWAVEYFFAGKINAKAKLWFDAAREKLVQQKACKTLQEFAQKYGTEVLAAAESSRVLCGFAAQGKNTALKVVNLTKQSPQQMTQYLKTSLGQIKAFVGSGIETLTVPHIFLDKNPFKPTIKSCTDLFNKMIPSITSMKLFANIKEFAGKKLTIDFGHLFYPDFKFTCPLGTKGKLNGFHHDHGRNLFRQGVYELCNYKLFPGGGGAYKADVYISGGFVKPKSFFPAEWCEITLANKIIEALKSGKGVISRSQKNSNFLYNTITSCGVKMQFVISPDAKIITVYPTK